MNMRVVVLAVVWTAAAATAGVLGACGSKASTSVEARGVTVGQELQDLEKARSDGLITEKEYQEQRQRILERNKK